MNKKIYYEKEFFNFFVYLKKERWVSYWHQIDEVVSDTVSSEKCTCLVIGNGDNIVPEVLEKYGVEVYTFDYSKDLQPDFCGDVREISKVIGDRKFDYILCCQILEHLEYSYFSCILEQISKHFKKKLIISLPQQTFKLEIKISIPKLPKINLYKIFYKSWIKDLNDDQHYWEIGIKNYPYKRIYNDLNVYYSIEKEYTDPINNYHHFFVLSNKN